MANSPILAKDDEKLIGVPFHEGDITPLDDELTQNNTEGTQSKSNKNLDEIYGEKDALMMDPDEHEDEEAAPSSHQTNNLESQASAAAEESE